ncbi:MAG TPA: [protein-PII] uridylyltransferase [Nitrospiraceae bacterium]|nr:[protein-PII] uridylyltransferase [Nitrospiraceae bacterium]
MTVTPGTSDIPTTGTAAAIAEQRQVLYQRLLKGTSGAEIMAVLTEFVDGVIIGRYRNAVREIGDDAVLAGFQHCCLVALGGYGRRELAPHSDIDVMLLYRPEAKRIIEPLSRHVLHHLWDLGFKVGHSVRTISDCVELALADLTVRTSMMEARFLAGSPGLFQEFHRRYVRRVVVRGTDRFIELKLAERQREYEKFGETVYLLEPNVKKSKGGLRDLHMLQWAGMARFQAQTVQELADRGILSRPDHRALIEAREFLSRIRALLHMQAGMAQEILTFDEQIRLAANFGFQDRPHLLAVEQFMQQYYRHTGALHEIARRFVDRCRKGSWWARLSRWLPSPRLDGHFVVAGAYLSVPLELRSRVLESPALLLRLFELSQSRQMKIDTNLLDEIHRHVEGLSDEAFREPEVSRIFLKILAGPGPVAATLEAMHRAHLLEKLIPVFATVRGLMQFNQYHKYTVDEHSLLAVAKAESLTREPGIFQEVYREIHRKDLLHLAILLHDLGKGHEQDHSDVGKAIADDTALRLRLDEQDARTLAFLVHRHLLMAHTAFRRDPYDEKVLLTFARSVGTPEVLRKLLILTAADIAAVGPGMLTKWKESLLIELYLRTLPELTGDRETGEEPERLAQIAREVAVALARSAGPAEGGLNWDADLVEAELRQFPLRYIYGTTQDRIAAHLRAIRRLTAGEVQVEHSFNAELGTCAYTVLAHNDLTPGIFSKIAGVMAAKGLQILDAQIVTRNDGIVVDTFQVTDRDYVGAPPADRRATIADTIRAVLKGEDTVERLVARSTRLPLGRPFPAVRQATEVQVDNETSDRFTIIDVFADDRQGLLYVITHAIFRLGLSVHAARISTRLDQVADVFYVTDLSGVRPEEPGRLEKIRETIKEEIDRFLQEGVDEGEGVSSSSS